MKQIAGQLAALAARVEGMDVEIQNSIRDVRAELGKLLALRHSRNQLLVEFNRLLASAGAAVGIGDEVLVLLNPLPTRKPVEIRGTVVDRWRVMIAVQPAGEIDESIARFIPRDEEGAIIVGPSQVVPIELQDRPTIPEEPDSRFVLDAGPEAHEYSALD